MPKVRSSAAHHSAPCLHPTASGLPCPNRARDHHPEHGPVCAMHAHHNERSEGRTATILVHLHPKEKEGVSIAAQTLGITLSDLGRVMLLGLEVPLPPRPTIDAKTHGELGKVGSNLNQIAKRLNEGGPVEVIQLRNEVENLTVLLRRVQAALAGA